MGNHKNTKVVFTMTENNAPTMDGAMEDLLEKLMGSVMGSNSKRQNATRQITINLGDLTGDTSNYDDKDITIEESEIKVNIDFPLNNPATFTGIYAEEDRTTSVPAGCVMGGLNRNTTDGTYGIYGYEIGHLTIDDAYLGQDGIWRI